MFAKQPAKPYRLGDSLPGIPGSVTSWPWPGSAALTKWSLDMLKYPLGTIITDVVDGHPVIAQIQTHSWYGAHPDWPATPHKGTSVFVPTTVDASGKKVAMADPPDGWGQEPSTVAGVGECAQGDPLCTDLPDESAPPPPPPAKKKRPVSTDTVFLNGRPVGVGENFCPTLPYNCPPRPWGPDPGPTVSISDRLGTGSPSVAGVGAFPIIRRPAPPLSPTARRPAPPPPPARVAAHQAVVARAWRPEWGNRPTGFGAAQWRPEWGSRPAWFGARRWRDEWGAQPAWWDTHLTVQQDDPQPPTPSDASPDPSTSTPPSGAPSSPTAAAPGAGPATASPSAGDSSTKPGLSTLAKVGIAAG